MVRQWPAWTALGMGKAKVRFHREDGQHDQHCNFSDRRTSNANFKCDWTDANVERLVQLLKLRIRRPAPAYAFERGVRS